MTRAVVPPRRSELLLRRSLVRGPLADCIIDEMREEYATRHAAAPARAAAWYRRQVWGIVLRSLRDRIRGHGPFVGFTERTQRRGEAMGRTMRALRSGAKGLARSPQFTIAAALTLALAIGANTAIYSVVQGVLLKPLRYEDADRLVVLRHTAPGLGYDDFGISPALYNLYTGGSGSFVSSGMYTDASVNVTGNDAPPARVTAVRASRDVFSTLGIRPAMGRIFDETEDSPGGPYAVLLSHGLWQERFGGDVSIVGRTMRINGTEHTVVGVMPPRFSFPDAETQLWLPLAMDSASRDYGGFTNGAVARLRPGVDAAGAQAELRPLLARLRDDDTNIEAGDFTAFMDAGELAPVVRPLKDTIVGDVSRALWILLGTVAFVFLIACANVTNLFLVRAEARQKEMAVRAAMGAKRGSLIAHYAAESVLIAAAGGALGLVLAWAGLRALLRMAPPNIPRLDEVAIDPGVLFFAVAVTGLAAVLLGVLPALRLTSPDLLSMLGRSSRGLTANRERNRTRQLLVVAQTALALVLLVGTGLMVRSFQHIRALDAGFDPRNAVTFRITLPPSLNDAQVASFHRSLVDRLREIPGVEGVGATTHAPLAGCCSGTAHQVEEFPVEPGQMPPMFWYSTVSDGYFETMRIPLVAGRFFDATDRTESPRSIVVSEVLAKRFWPDSDPVGRRISLSADTGWYTIVGVAGSVRDRALREEPSDMVYYPVGAATGQARSMTYVIRTPRGAEIAQLARDVVWSLDDTLPIAASATYEKIVADSMIRLSFTMLALIAASTVALLLGAIGLYSVISYLVTQRTNEIGIRLALGARPTQVRAMVVLQGGRLALLGLIIGTGAALGLTRLMQGMLYGTEPNDPVTFIVVCLFLTAIAGLATYLPAYRASRIDPAASLKTE